MTNITSKWYTPFAKATNDSQNLVYIVEKVTPLVCFIGSDISGDHGIMNSNCYCYYVIGYVSRSVAFRSVKKDINCAEIFKYLQRDTSSGGPAKVTDIKGFVQVSSALV